MLVGYCSVTLEGVCFRYRLTLGLSSPATLSLRLIVAHTG